jgi:hypothetical protein
VATLDHKDLNLDHKVSVAKHPDKHFKSNMRSARYLQPIGEIAECISLCVVAPMQNLSAKVISFTFVCQSKETNVCQAGTSSKMQSYVTLIIIEV